MLYKLGSSSGKFNKLEPIAFKDFASFGRLEKDLEELIAKSILNVLFEESSLMPIFQERQYQGEADIYALNERGELVIFELKRGLADKNAVNQILRYSQDAGQWSYSILQKKYNQYKDKIKDLAKEHQEAFNLEHALDSKAINNKQHLIIIGSAADNSLLKAVDYWKKQNISIEFLPYRIYELSGEKYFEFFSLPYDNHKNPSDSKGVLFDTNKTYDENFIWEMIENKRVQAFGDSKNVIEYLHPGDIIFFSHLGSGLVAAAKVNNDVIKNLDDETLYKDVEFITKTPKKKEKIVAMPFKMVSEITGKSFFWARTIKVPYLSKDEAENLVRELKTYLEK